MDPSGGQSSKTQPLEASMNLRKEETDMRYVHVSHVSPDPPRSSSLTDSPLRKPPLRESPVRVCSARKPSRDDRHYQVPNQVVKLLPGETLGWWSTRRPDQRIKPRAIVEGAINDVSARVLLDSGANISILSGKFAKRIGLRGGIKTERPLTIQGVGAQPMVSQAKAEIKITLGWRVVYVFETWIGDHNGGCDLILGTDFLMSAGIVLDMFRGRATLPEEMVIPLANRASSNRTRAEPRIRVEVRKFKVLDPGNFERIPVSRPLGIDDPVLWVRHNEGLLPSVVCTRTGAPRWLEVHNASASHKTLSVGLSIALWIRRGELPWEEGYVRVGSKKYQEWQVLIYEATFSDEFKQREYELYAEWLRRQPPAVSKPEYVTPTRVMGRTTMKAVMNATSSDDPKPSREEHIYEKRSQGHEPIADDAAQDIGHAGCARLDGEDSCNMVTDGLSTAATPEKPFAKDTWFISSTLEVVLSAMDESTFQHEGAEMYAEDFGEELAVLPEIESSNEVAEIDVDAIEIGSAKNTLAEIAKMRNIVRQYSVAFIDSGNAAPPEAKGVKCDIDVGDAKPVAQRARPVRQEYLAKLHELLKALLAKKLIVFSDSPWASPIVIVIKKNKQDIRLCIDYRVVNSLTRLMVASMPLADELLANFEAMMWYCSFDACSGFWSVGMTERARKVSAFICPLGHFEWLRMPQGLKNAPQIYQRMLDNAIWGFVKPAEGWEAELFAKDMFSLSEADSNRDPVFHGRSYIDDISFGAATWDECCEKLERFLKRMIECRITLSLPKSQFGQPAVDFLSHSITRDGLLAKPKDLKGLLNLEFPSTKKGLQSFLGTLNYYSKFIQEYAAKAAILYEFDGDDFKDSAKKGRALKAFSFLKETISSTPVLKHFDTSLLPEIILFANDWSIGATLGQRHDGILHPVRFTGRVLKDAELRYIAPEKEALALLRVLKNYFYLLRGKRIKVYSRFSTMKWLLTSKNLHGRALQFAVMLSPWELEVQKMAKGEWGLTGLLASSIVPPDKMDSSLRDIFPEKLVKRVSAKAEYVLPGDYDGLVMSTDGSAKPPDKGANGSFAFIVWKVPEWSVVHAQSEFSENLSVNEAEYHGILSGLSWLLAKGYRRVVVASDSRIATQQLTGAIQCHKANLQLLLNKISPLSQQMEFIQFIHVPRDYNRAADFLASTCLKTCEGHRVETDIEKEDLRGLNRLREVLFGVNTDERLLPEFSKTDALAEDPQADRTYVHVADAYSRPPREVAALPQERLRRIGLAQDEETRWLRLKQFLRGDLSEMSQREAEECIKIAEMFDLTSDGVLYYIGHSALRKRSSRTHEGNQDGRQDENQSEEPLREEPDQDFLAKFRLVVPSTLREDILASGHMEMQGGHQGISRTYLRLKKEFYWPNMFADVQRFVSDCEDCSSGKGRPRLRGHSPGNLLANRPFQIVSMDFVTPLPETHRGNKSLLLFQDSFSGFVMCKPMAVTEALDVAKAFNECVFQRFGACEMLRHDRDPRFLAEVLVEFNRMLGQRQRATLSYRPQANGQQERSVKTVTQSVKAYISDPEQKDWDDVVESLMFALNTSYDFTRKETPFFLVHGWDARNTISAMVPSVQGRGALREEPSSWRRSVKRNHEYAQRLAWELQRAWKQRRADRHNEDLTDADLEIKEGDSVWLYINNVKPGFAKKLAHLWHGPFRVKKKKTEFSVLLDLPDSEGYRFFPEVHVSRLKLRRQFPSRPVDLVGFREQRFDFDEALLPEDSFIQESRGEYEVEKILDMRWKRITRQGRKEKEYLVKWVGYDEPTWVAESNLSCGGLIFDFDQERKRRSRLEVMQVADEAD